MFGSCLSVDPREYCISTKEFLLDDEDKLKGLNTVRVEWTKDSAGRWKMEEVPGSEKYFPAQLVFLALGFLGPEQDLLKSINVKLDGRGNIVTPPKVRRRGYILHKALLLKCPPHRNTRPASPASLLLATVVVASLSSSGVSSEYQSSI